MEGRHGSGRRFVISVGASSKKAGKSSLASRLVKELGAEYGLKVSSGGSHDDRGIVDDPSEVSMPGTDTGSLVEAGAEKVIWVSSPADRLAADLQRAMEMFPPGGILVVEGNSALEHIDPDFAVFVMNVPFDRFKPSASRALERADLVVVGLGRAIPGAAGPEVGREIARRAPRAKLLFYSGGREGFESATRQVVEKIRGRLTAS